MPVCVSTIRFSLAVSMFSTVLTSNDRIRPALSVFGYSAVIAAGTGFWIGQVVIDVC